MGIRKTFSGTLAVGLLVVCPLTGALAETTTGYDKGFFIKSDQWDLHLGTRMQLQFASLNPDTFQYDSLLGSEEDTDNLNDLFVRRFKFFMSGSVYRPSIKWKVQFDTVAFRSGGGTAGNIRLEEAFVDLTEKPWTQLRLGQYKVPFGYEKMTSSGKLNLVDRSIVHTAFGVEQEPGINLYGQSFERKFRYDVSITTGVSDNKGFDTRNEANANGKSDFRYIGRVTWEPLSPYVWEQGAVSAPDQPQLTLQAALHSNQTAVPLDNDPFLPKDRIMPFSRGVLGANSNTFDAATDTFLNGWTGVSNSRKSYDRNELELVAGFKLGRFAIEAQGIGTEVDPDLKYLKASNGELRDLDISALGARLQAGVFLIPTRLELAGRAAMVNRESKADFATQPDVKQEIDQTEYRAGLNWYFSKHDWKWQFDIGQISTEWKLDGHKLAVPERSDFAGGVGYDDRAIQNNTRKDLEFRTQFQLQF